MANTQNDPPVAPNARTGEPSRAALQLLLSMGRDLLSENPARAAECLQQARDLAHELADPVPEAQALLSLAALELQRGEAEAARASAQSALALARAADDTPLSAAALNGLGRILLRQGQVLPALDHLRESLGHTTELDPAARMRHGTDPRIETLELLGVAHTMAGHSDQALRYYEEALEKRQAENNPAGVAKVLNQLGNLRHRMGQYPEAVRCYRQALEHMEEAGDARGAAATANNLASTHMRLGEMAEATRLFEQCRVQLEKLGDAPQVAKILLNLGLLAQSRGRLGEAQTACLESLKRHRALGDTAGESYALVNLSLLALARGRPEEAMGRADEGLALLQRAGLQDAIAPGWVCRGLALLELEQLNEAAHTAGEALRAAETAGARDQKAEALALLTMVQVERGEHAVAATTARRALDLAEEIGDPELLATACRCLGVVIRSRGELEEAKLQFTRAARCLRGWDDSYELARIRFEEGLLLAMAGASEGAAERLRRVRAAFGRLGNRRWQVLAGLLLAEVVAKSSPRDAIEIRREAQAAALEAQAPGLMDLGQRRVQDLLKRDAASVSCAEEVRSDPGALTQLATDLQVVARGSGGPRELIERFREYAARELAAVQIEIEFTSPRIAARIAARMFPDLGDESTGSREWATTEGNRRVRARLSGDRLVLEDSAAGQPQKTALVTLVIEPPDGPAEMSAVRALRLRRPGDTFTTADQHQADVAGSLLLFGLELYLARTGRQPLPLEAPPGDARLDGMVGGSVRMREIYTLIAQVAPTDSNVLILGESGTGKELVARSIHMRSRRGSGPFIAISCPSIPRDLLESELFGHERGAFTGAHEARPGKIEMADGGTLFLDEIGDMPPTTQAKILRFLQEREFTRVGGRAMKRVDVRVLSATSRDLSAEMRDGAFREDLYYRLNVVPIEVPPLRQRAEDIPLLVTHFLATFHGRAVEGAPSTPSTLSAETASPTITAEAMEQLGAHSWPGNVRELRNTIEHMLTLSEGGPLEARHIPASLRRKLAQEAVPGETTAASLDRSGGRLPRNPSGSLALSEGETLESRLIELEADLIRWALERERGNQSAAARRLGITESKIRNRMKLYGIRRRAP